MPSVSIIIANWNSGNQLLSCLKSIVDANRTIFKLNQVVVVDNASTDDSISGLDDLCLPLQIISNTNNMGFAAACNQGVQEGKTDYLLFLNPDMVLFKDSLDKSVGFFLQKERSQIGIVGIQLINEYGQVSRTCCRFPSPKMFLARLMGFDRMFPDSFPGYFMREWDHKESKEMDHVIGAYYLVDRHLFESLHGFDERFFVYLEDLDFSLRAHKAGWSSYYLAEAQAFHKGGGSSEQVKAARLFYSLRSRILYCYKHFSWSSATGVLLGTLFVEPVSRIAYAAIRLSGREIAETLKGYAMLWKDSPNWVRKLTAKT